jgi:hypothetical protein
MAYADDSFHWQVFSINERRFSVTWSRQLRKRD